MRLATKFILFVLISSFTGKACEVKKDKKVIIFSGSVTFLMRELGLLNSPQVKAVSHYFLNESERKEFKEKTLLGGIFLSSKSLSRFKEHDLIFDKSLELKKQFSRTKLKSLSEIDTRNLNPFESVHKSIGVLRPLVTNCFMRILKLTKKMKLIKENIKSLNWKKQKVLFFLGEIEKKKYPQMMMLNDGFVRYLRELGKITTYESDTSYNIWSQKILNKYMDSNVKVFGLRDSIDKKLKIKSIRENHWNLQMSGMLIPGLGQLYFLNELISFLKKN